MAFTALSYARMSAEIPLAGSAYTYTQKKFGAPTGFLAGCLKRIFGHVSIRYSTPVYAILVVSAVSLLAIVIERR